MEMINKTWFAWSGKLSGRHKNGILNSVKKNKNYFIILKVLQKLQQKRWKWNCNGNAMKKEKATISASKVKQFQLNL